MIVEHNQSTYNGGQYDNAYKFNGKELDDATQMYYYGARYYDPRISIFVSLDPLVEQTFEPYSYVGNNPIMFTDPTGMIAEGWYENSQGEIKYDKNINNQKDLDDRNINGEFIAKSFVGKDQNEKYFNFSSDGKISKLDKGSVSDNAEVVDVISEWKTISEERRVHNSGESTVAQLGAAVAISQTDSPAPGPADVFAALVVIKVLYEAVTGANSHTTSEQVLKFAKDAGKNDRHGDGGRGLTKAERQIADLESKLAGASGNEAKKIRQKIKNVRESAKNKKKGEEHSRANKR